MTRTAPHRPPHAASRGPPGPGGSRSGAAVAPAPDDVRRVVAFEHSSTGRTGWRISTSDGGSGEPATLADALALLSPDDAPGALAVHASALEATCVLIGALQRAAGTDADPHRLARLAALAARAHELAYELAAAHGESRVRDGAHR